MPILSRSLQRAAAFASLALAVGPAAGMDYPGRPVSIITRVVQLAIESLSGLAGPIQSGMLKPLAVASTRRVPDYPDLSTVAEAVPALGAFEAQGWFALTTPAGTPDAIVNKISGDLRAILVQPNLQKRFAALGTYARALPPAETALYIRSEQTRWKPVVTQVMVAGH